MQPYDSKSAAEETEILKLEYLKTSKTDLGVGGGKVLSLSFFFIFTYVVELPFLVSKSAHLSSNSRRFRFYRHLKVGRRSEKWPKNTVF